MPKGVYKHTSRPCSEATKEKISLAQKGIPRPYQVGHICSDETRKKIGKANSIALMGRKLTEETKIKIRNAGKGKHTGPFSHEHRMKLRMAKLGKHAPTVGSNEKILLDAQEIFDDCKIDRNFSVIGYKPDGYCHETNTVYEVYEKFHGNQIAKDLQREFEIRSHLNCCNFMIIYDNTH